MSKFFRKLHEDIMRAPLSFGFLCFGAGMYAVMILRSELNLSDGSIAYVTFLVGVAGIVYFNTNRKEERPTPTPQGEEKGGPA